MLYMPNPCSLWQPNTPCHTPLPRKPLPHLRARSPTNHQVADCSRPFVHSKRHSCDCQSLVLTEVEQGLCKRWSDSMACCGELGALGAGQHGRRQCMQGQAS